MWPNGTERRRDADLHPNGGQQPPDSENWGNLTTLRSRPGPLPAQSVTAPAVSAHGGGQLGGQPRPTL
jgi:hypothetical protein